MITQHFDKWVPFLGIVEDVDDPRRLGRVKIRCIGVHPDDLPVDQLDWATPIMPPTSAGIQQMGSSPTGLLKGSRVVGFYFDGESRTMPMILGTFAAIPGNDDERHDVSKLARGTNTVENKAVGPEPSSAYASEYPHNKVIQTTSGHVVELDDTPGAERIHVRHSSGSYIEMGPDGRVVVKAADDMFDIVTGDREQYTQGKSTVHSKGKLTVRVDADAEINVKGNCKLISSKKITLTAPVVDLAG